MKEGSVHVEISGEHFDYYVKIDYSTLLTWDNNPEMEQAKVLVEIHVNFAHCAPVSLVTN